MKTSRRKFLNKRSLLCIRFGFREIQRYGPANFYQWSKKSQHKFLNRFGEWTECSNGVPWDCGGKSAPIALKKISKIIIDTPSF